MATTTFVELHLEQARPYRRSHVANWCSLCESLNARVAKTDNYSTLEPHFAMSYDFPHDFTGRGVFNVLDGVLSVIFAILEL